MPEEIIEGSGNIYADLGLPDAEEVFLKSSIAIEIRNLIAAKGYTQAEVAKQVGLTQPKVSDIVRGRLEGYSVERLLNIINRLGHDVEVRISKKEASPGMAGVKVRAA